MTKEVWDDWSIDVASETGKTNINNTNYINNTNNINNNINYFTRCDEITSEEEVMETPAGASGIASRPGKPQLAALLPKGWRGLKLDLFNNGRGKNNQALLKLKLGIIKQDGTAQSFIASFGSPNEYVWRTITEEQLQEPQWKACQKLMDGLDSNAIPYNVSKCSKQNKGGSIPLVAFLFANYEVVILRDGVSWSFCLDQEPTDKQRQGKIIATKFIGQSARSMPTLEELGI